MASDRSKQARREVRVGRRGVDHDEREVLAQRSQVLADGLSARGWRGGVGHRTEPPQVLVHLRAVREHDLAIDLLTEGEQVRHLLHGLAPEVREDVPHVDVQIRHRGLLLRDAGQRGGQVRGQEGLPHAALGGEHRDDRASMLGRGGLLPPHVADVLRPQDRALHGIAELLASAGQVHHVPDPGTHGGGKQSVPGLVPHDDDRGHRGDPAHELGQAERVGLPHLRGHDEDVGGVIAVVHEDLLRRDDALHPADRVVLDLQRPSERRPERLGRPHRDDLLLDHFTTWAKEIGSRAGRSRPAAGGRTTRDRSPW
jgi:hypothetical protein